MYQLLSFPYILFSSATKTLSQIYRQYKKNNNLKKKNNMLTYDSRLLRAVRASSGEPIVTNAKPLFLVLLCIESLTNTAKYHKPISEETKPISKNSSKQIK